MLYESQIVRTRFGTARESQSHTVLRIDVNPFASRPESVWRVFHCSEHGLVNSLWADVHRVPHFLHEAAQQPSLGLTATTAFPNTSRFTRCSSAGATRAGASSALLVPSGSSALAPPFSAIPWPNKSSCSPRHAPSSAFTLDLAKHVNWDTPFQRRK